MIILKLKAIIYRYTRVYLADKEEQEYVKTLGDMSEDLKDMNVGLWQADYGFTIYYIKGLGRMLIYRLKYPKLKYPIKVFESLVTFFYTLYQDIRSFKNG